MNDATIRRVRLYNQLLTTCSLKEPQEVVSWMGAMQAQAYSMAKWAIGLRLPETTDRLVEQAINEGKIIRTHIMRPTWHFVSADDIYWMLELTAPRIKSIIKNYHKHFNDDDLYLERTTPLMLKVLEKEPHLTKQEIADRMNATGLDIDLHRLGNVMTWAELDAVVCNGIVKGSKQTYCLLETRAKKKASLTKDEAIAKLAERYFSSHGPATLQDFVWWSGLTTTDARKGIEYIQPAFISEKKGEQTYWFKSDLQLPPDSDEPSTLLLPAFDEYIVGYKDRAEILVDKHYKKVISMNGIFSPAVTLNGEIIGTWKNASIKSKGAELTFFEKVSKKTESLFKPVSDAYKSFRNG
ncbi:hypothetical protein M2459_003315 [Parabacteroides sp. PF5-5]|uniref:winged helix DNA-binding domain-containing protein n=1 Tax=unclassified Parabacteroides TaxID=2649774 RepID=UPI0024739FFF|nr:MULTISPECIES: winged helix DNA-binding domain-containing protein [unclassified Parabacteroides]MDH6306590.1 hypothetical protein [Parabacteroides sp. PH5-39]MDH6317557.1 hypothetical protein [Parabacteroides sp. PF5-13]MDH6321301.1 hypothetical protein [Parabacteroides sp. PH5-13]MDH6325033.1 hypothetical protein [Parabacteroides sp. PH5-8]MDH6328742.1 hypothetical protein [Parabacteroides sp. PH5-41]